MKKDDASATNAVASSVLYILWGAMVLSVVIYGVVGMMVTKQRPTGVDTRMLQVLEIAFGALSLIVTIGIFGILPRVVKRVGYMIYCLLRWALTESIAIYGLVLYLLGDSQAIFFGFLGWSLLLFLLLFPSQADQRRFVHLQN